MPTLILMFRKPAVVALTIAAMVFAASVTSTAQLREGKVARPFEKGPPSPDTTIAYVTGRVTDVYGRGISRARISLFDLDRDAEYTATSNAFGYYRINDLPVGDFYVMSVAHKRYLFLNGSVSFMLDDNLTGINFLGEN
ncbi:MAG: carboxypeptidase regulatory-like domain-containing protein [Blastocatellia bacterium]|nr:carboxypeptidase regulatory-like domain-containing protein [Blastocatellia bacterium]